MQLDRLPLAHGQHALDVVVDDLDDLAAADVLRLALRRDPKRRDHGHLMPRPPRPGTASSAARTFARARWSSTRWLTSEMPRISQASSASKPSTSRSVITARWFSGSVPIGGGDAPAGLVGEQPLLGHVARAARARRPMAGPAVAVAEEAIRLDGRLVVGVAAEAREGHAAALALAPRLGRVREDPEDPGLQRRAALEAVEALEDAEPGFLDDLLGDGTARHEHHRHPQHRRARSGGAARGRRLRRRQRSCARRRCSSGGRAVVLVASRP